LVGRDILRTRKSAEGPLEIARQKLLRADVFTAGDGIATGQALDRRRVDRRLLGKASGYGTVTVDQEPRHAESIRVVAEAASLFLTRQGVRWTGRSPQEVTNRIVVLVAGDAPKRGTRSRRRSTVEHRGPTDPANGSGRRASIGASSRNAARGATASGHG
jgi:hypothetical protein